jgi:nitrate reductase NapE component
MIDPVSAFAALSAGHSAIKKGIEMGRDLSSMSNAVSRYAQGEAELQFGAARKKKAKFSLAEDSAIEKHFRKEQLEDMRNELRKIFQWYGKPGQWERLQAEIANERAEIKKRLEEEAKKKDLILAIAISVVLVTVAVVGGYYYITWLQSLNT